MMEALKLHFKDNTELLKMAEANLANDVNLEDSIMMYNCDVSPEIVEEIVNRYLK